MTNGAQTPSRVRRVLSHLYAQVLIGVLLGAVVGLCWPDVGTALGPLGDGFVKLIKMVVAPIIFCTVVVGILLLPMILIFLNTGLSALEDTGTLGSAVTDSPWYDAVVLLGETPVALLVTLMVALVAFGWRRGTSKKGAQDLLEGALPKVCSVILITGAGGMFGGVLQASGIGDALASSLSGLGFPLILAGFIIAATLRVVQGSATVALTTTAGLIASGVTDAGYNNVQLAAMVVAVAAGSVVLSHVNDSGFWLVGNLLELDEVTTLRIWTVLETLIGVVGFLLACAVFGVGSLW